jgi:hypothetical protein
VAEATRGRSASGLVAALVRTKTVRLQSALAGGEITAAQQRARLATLRVRAQAWVARPRGGARAGSLLSDSASYLGTTPAKIRAQERAGRSLAQLADATRGKSAAGLIEAVVDAQGARLAAGATGVHPTAARERALESALRQRVTAEVNASPSGRRAR